MENFKKVNPFTLDIIKDSLYAIGEEMFISVARSSKSPVIYEVLDFASGLTDAKGRLLTQGNGATGFIGMLNSMVKEVIDKFVKTGNINEGDIIIINDPYSGGGSHLSDVGLVMPIYYKGNIVAFSANKAHWTEVGGKDPGSWTVDSTEIYQEGLQFPCVKICNKGVMNEALIDVIKANVRFPDLSIGDMWAQIAGMRTGEKRVIELCEKFGKETVLLAIEKLLKNSEELSRKQIMALPDGEYEAEDWIDDDGVGNGPFKVKVKVTIKGDEFTADFRGSQMQVPGPINVSFAGLLSAVRIIFLAATNPSQDVNDGVFSPLKIIVDDASIFSAERPAAVSTYWETMLYGVDLIWKALAPILPDKLTAGHLLSVCGFVFAGIHPDTKESYIAVGPSLGGWGAGKGKDGENAQFCIGDGETFNIPVEVLETRYGFFVEEYKLRADGAGAGEYRGGSGVVRTYRMLNDGNYFTGTFGRFKYLPWGMSGGHEGSRNEFEILKADGSVDGPFGKYARYPINKGDAVKMSTATGGGYGNPFDRHEEKVAMDVKNEFVSIKQANDDYGVIIDPITLNVKDITAARKKHCENKE
ncbi:hydantoinase B/oxoprolinase family protein [Maledivibacter halophilus]|uniref:N-methylhydantoinase B n=1 Tax=Maledivibacter halophilus TaxID=36842 RepID=A0A1T5MRV9_9FIRM|nr:hydantoinase B/oxoprolinase family protein [Maledivibacter halophilus]SKC90955.1 N-methylhydantoinase B [Maledivibacter halophilus]